MGQRINEIKNNGNGNKKITFDHYSGGVKRGPMLQITQGVGTIINFNKPGFIQLTKGDGEKVAKIINKWLEEEK